jgi:hypothetical protein
MNPYPEGLETSKDSMMENYAQWMTILLHDLHALTQLRGLDEMSMMRYRMKEQDISVHCYQAEESLTDAELALLKKEIHLSELMWRVYKSKIRPEAE